MKARFFSGGITLAVGAVLMCVPATANVLAPGVAGPPDPLVETGTIIATTGVQTFSTATYSGTYEAVVYRTAAGTLDFGYQFQNNSGSLDAIERATAANFTGFITDVGFSALQNINTYTGTVAPTTVDRSLSGGTIGFNFGPIPGGVLPGQTSDLLLIDTNAVSFTTGTLSLIDANVFTGGAFAPTTVPEPASMLLLGTMLFGAGVLLRTKMNASRS